MGYAIGAREAEIAILADAGVIKAALEGVTAEGDTFTIPETYRAQVDSMTNGSSASGPNVYNLSNRWIYNYDNGTFTVTQADNEETATAYWHVSKSGYEATVTLTLTGTNGAATYTKGEVVVSGVNAMS